MIFKKIHTKIWSDKKFKSLNDESKLLFQYLLQSPFSTTLPGIYIAGTRAICEHLSWDEDKFYKNLSILSSKEMAYYDKETSLVYLPNYIKYEKNTSKNKKDSNQNNKLNQMYRDALIKWNLNDI